MAYMYMYVLRVDIGAGRQQLRADLCVPQLRCTLR